MALCGAAVGCGLSGKFVSDSAGLAVDSAYDPSCSYSCAARSRVFLGSRTVVPGRARKAKRRDARDLYTVFAAEDESDLGRETDRRGGSSEADVEALEARLGVGRRARREGGSGEASRAKAAASAAKEAPEKKWDEMNMMEQAWSLYIGEKGVLFWLNKLAYASIFVVIGGWIVFRFVGPALGWYELDSPLLAPDRILGGP